MSEPLIYLILFFVSSFFCYAIGLRTGYNMRDSEISEEEVERNKE